MANQATQPSDLKIESRWFNAMRKGKGDSIMPLHPGASYLNEIGYLRGTIEVATGFECSWEHLKVTSEGVHVFRTPNGDYVAVANYNGAYAVDVTDLYV